MATVKQCKLLAARAKEAGVEWDFDDGKDLQNGEVDRKLEEFAVAKAKTDAAEAKVEEPQKLDQIRFGLACKVVLQKMEHYDVITEEKFAERVQRVYNTMQVAERRLR